MTSRTPAILCLLCLLACWFGLNLVAGRATYPDTVPAATTAVPRPAATDDCDVRADCVDL